MNIEAIVTFFMVMSLKRYISTSCQSSPMTNLSQIKNCKLQMQMQIAEPELRILASQFAFIKKWSKNLEEVIL